MEENIMYNRSIRITNITIENFKNVKYGTINLENKRKNYQSSIIGLYGQNGSGKTALIDSLELLKFVLCGKQVPTKYSDYINVDTNCSKFSFQFKIKSDNDIYDIWYQFDLKKLEDDIEDTGYINNIKAVICDEVISYSFESGGQKIRKNTLIDTRTNEVFIPKSKYADLIGDDIDVTDLIVTKKLLQATSKSFIFSREMINIFRKNCSNAGYLNIIEYLYAFGFKELFIINTGNTGLISMNQLPLYFKIKENNSEVVGNIMINLNEPTQIPEQSYNIVDKIITNLNIVLEQIVPDLKIAVHDFGSSLNSNGKLGRTIQLVSLKNKHEIPFQYESEGIKKIVSILQLLIVVYNNPSITVAIDELDSGIFEYLLGELLNIISEKGKGQLVFTSHNLRPLETIDKGFIAFTTTNPNNRYIRLTNVKENNNLRDFYFRDIVLGEQNEQVYNPTNNFEIALAFREAGEPFGS
jgi:AAA15 family ATPase/GTPase